MEVRNGIIIPGFIIVIIVQSATGISETMSP